MGLYEGEGEARQARGDSHIFADVLYQMPKQLLLVIFVYYPLKLELTAGTRFMFVRLCGRFSRRKRGTEGAAREEVGEGFGSVGSKRI